MARVRSNRTKKKLKNRSKNKRGVLKRRRSTPVSAWVLIASRALTAAIIAIVLVIVVVVIGRIAYGVSFPSATIPGLVISVVVGAACFCCLAFALASFIRNEDAAQPIVQATVLPLYFISGIFIPKNQLSGTLKDIADVFPVSHLSNALCLRRSTPAPRGPGSADTTS